MSDKAAMQVAAPWHREVLQELLTQHKEGRLPHALLLCGAKGTGKRRLAKALLEAILCRSPVGGLACGACQTCHLSAAGSHPDLVVLQPEEEGKAIRIDPVRALVEFCSLTPQYGDYRLALVAPAEAMNRNAQNALLKTLEEPGNNTLLLLLSDQPGRLLATVRSRCQLRMLEKPNHAVALSWLTDQVGQPERAAALLSLASGAPLRALSLDGSEWFAEREKLLKQCLSLLAGRVPASMAAQSFVKLDVSGVLDALYGWSHDGLQYLARGREPEDQQLSELLKKLADRAGSERLLAFAEQVARCRRWLANGNNPNRDLMFEQLLLVLVGVDAGVSAF